MRTHVEDASHTHYFGSEGNLDEKGTNESTVEILDLTTRTFRKIVRTSGTVSFVFTLYLILSANLIEEYPSNVRGLCSSLVSAVTFTEVLLFIV